MNRINRLSLPIAGLLLCCPAATQELATEAQHKDPVVMVATLGATTRQPTRDEVKELGLKWEVRVRGQVGTDVAEDGAASKAGIVQGDVIVKLGGVEVFSQDDIADVLRVSLPGQKVSASILRAKSEQEDVVAVSLGQKKVKAPKTPQLEWDYASLANLDAALAAAKQDKKLVLVGLTGAET